jgi:hypothetical protein
VFVGTATWSKVKMIFSSSMFHLSRNCTKSPMVFARSPAATSPANLATVGRVTAGLTEGACVRAGGGATTVPCIAVPGAEGNAGRDAAGLLGDAGEPWA